MNTVSFIPGQRWVSTTESELGLGIVLETSSRRVELDFPATGERRTYATDNAPLSRVQYQEGEQVTSEDGQALTIQAVMENNGCLIYLANDSKGEEVILPELQLNSFVQFSKPQDRLFAGQIDEDRAFELRCETLGHLHQLQQSEVRGLLGPRVQLLPHQLYIASEVSRRNAPRVLLADEVGLGKTIEAGLILHQQLISGRVRRAMILVPDSLLHQWLVEMLRRFNMSFTILDEDRCQALEESVAQDDDEDDDEVISEAGSNPFESAQLVLCTLSFLSGNKQRHAQAMAADWDLLIVDEAHHLQWSEEEASPAYRAVEALASHVRGLLLLTATPEQLGVESHFARLRLLDPDRYHDFQIFVDEELKHQAINKLLKCLLAEDAREQLLQEPNLQKELKQYLGDDRALALQELASSEDEEGFELALTEVKSNLLDRHGTGRVLFRNTRSSVSGFPEREFHEYPLPVPDAYLEASAGAPVEQLLAPELLLGEDWLSVDPRVQWLESWLTRQRGQKILVICAHAATAISLEEHLRLRAGVFAAAFHEGLSLIARDRAAAYFADEEEGAQVLICSEIGSEGRNFQFSHHLVLFDLPLNPDLLEQRIGRLDRIGQRHTVDIHAPYFEGSAQAVLKSWYHQGINAFESTCPAGPMLYDIFEEDLRHCLQQAEDEVALSDLLEKTRVKTADTLRVLQQGRDRLLELNSFNETRADEVIHEMVDQERRHELSAFMEQALDQFGVEQEYHSSNSLVLRPGNHMLVHSFPALPEDGLTATYQRELALSREDIHFFTWEHPMVSGAMDLVLGGEFGNTAFCTLKLPPLKQGAVLLEAIFTLSCTAPSELQLTRYLPLTTVRVLVDQKSKDWSAALGIEQINRLSRKVHQRTAQELVRHTRPQITRMISHARSLAEEQQDTILADASASMHSAQAAELDRLEALALVNPNIRKEEIQILKNREAQLQQYLEAAQLRLDAIRVLMVSA